MTENDNQSITLAKTSLEQMLTDTRLPDAVRQEMSGEFAQIKRMLTKLESQQIHIAVFGRVSVGKSSLLNAISGEELFEVSVLHGKTKVEKQVAWQKNRLNNVFLIDTPGIDEAEAAGKAREVLAKTVATVADIVLFVVDSDLTASELVSFKQLVRADRPVLLVLNKSDRFSTEEQGVLLESLSDKVRHWVGEGFILSTSSKTGKGIQSLKESISSVLQKEGKDLAALNAGLFATHISEKIADRLIEARSEAADKIIGQYCIAKGVAVALNPVPVVDLISAGAVDATMLVHLSKVYGVSLTLKQSNKLLKVIGFQMIGLWGVVWATHFIASALKLGSGGLSTVITATTQGAIAWYSTVVVGQVAKVYFKNGHSWGEGGPKQVVEQILETLDKDSIIAEARAAIKEKIN